VGEEERRSGGWHGSSRINEDNKDKGVAVPAAAMRRKAWWW